MTIKECYEAMGADYADASRRLMSDRLIQKFTLKFLDDPSYGELCRNMDAGDFAEAFRAAHTLKGVSQNLSFTRLHQSSAVLSDALKGGQTEGLEPLLWEVKQDYQMTAEAIRQFRDGLPG